jgi:hypothetical protein
MCHDKRRRGGPDALMLIRHQSSSPTVEIINADDSASIPTKGVVLCFFRILPQYRHIRFTSDTFSTIIPGVGKQVELMLRPSQTLIRAVVEECQYRPKYPSVGRVKLRIHVDILEPEPDSEPRGPIVHKVRRSAEGRRASGAPHEDTSEESDEIDHLPTDLEFTTTDYFDRHHGIRKTDKDRPTILATREHKPYKHAPGLTERLFKELLSSVPEEEDNENTPRSSQGSSRTPRSNG